MHKKLMFKVMTNYGSKKYIYSTQKFSNITMGWSFGEMWKVRTFWGYLKKRRSYIWEFKSVFMYTKTTIRTKSIFFLYHNITYFRSKFNFSFCKFICSLALRSHYFLCYQHLPSSLFPLSETLQVPALSSNSALNDKIGAINYPDWWC